jgi:hypothetical protein
MVTCLSEQLFEKNEKNRHLFSIPKPKPIPTFEQKTDPDRNEKVKTAGL